MARHLALVAALCLPLAACGDPVEELRNATTNLPPGCTITELGPYRDGWLVAVQCDGRLVTAISWAEGHCTSTGKTVICDTDRVTTVDLGVSA